MFTNLAKELGHHLVPLDSFRFLVTFEFDLFLLRFPGQKKRLHPAAAAVAPPRSSPPPPCRAHGRAERGHDPGRHPTWGTVKR